MKKNWNSNEDSEYKKGNKSSFFKWGCVAFTSTVILPTVGIIVKHKEHVNKEQQKSIK